MKESTITDQQHHAVPQWYACECCGIHGVQLWRELGSSQVMILCEPCSKYVMGHPGDAAPAIPISLMSRHAWISMFASDMALAPWWKDLPKAPTQQRIFEVKPDAECISILDKHGSLSVREDDAVNQRELLDQSLSIMVFHGLAPADWPARVAIWDEESEDRFRAVERLMRRNAIDRFAMPAILRNPRATEAAEKLLLENVGEDAYAGLRSWKSIESSSDAAQYLNSLPVAGGDEQRVHERGVLSPAWTNAVARKRASQKLSNFIIIAKCIAEVMLSANAPPWCIEVLKLGFGVWKFAPAETGGRATWALVARDGDGFPWPLVLSARSSSQAPAQVMP